MQILSAVTIFLILATFGFTLLRIFTKDLRLSLLVPAGLFFGVSIFILLLNLTSKVLPGRNGIFLSIFLVIGTAAYLYLKNQSFFTPSRTSIKRESLYIFITYLIVIFSVVAKMMTTLASADSDMQWAYAGHFARGTLPLKVPWQPDFEPSYHLGEYMFEGSLQVLSKLPPFPIHTIVNSFYLIGNLLFVLFLLWNSKKNFSNLWLILAALITFIGYGVMVSALPTVRVFSNLSESFLPPLYENIKLPPKIDSSGGGLVDLNSLSFLPARSLGIGIVFLVIFFLTTSWRSQKAKSGSLIAALSSLALVEESIFIALFASLGLLVIYDFFAKKIRSAKILIVVLVISLAVAIIQGGFFSDQIKPQNQSSFRITLPKIDMIFSEKLAKFNFFVLRGDDRFSWLVFSPIIFLLPTIIFSIKNGKPLLFLVSSFSFVNFCLYLAVEYIYLPSNNIRFYNMGFLFAGLGFFYFLFYLFQDRSKRTNLIVLMSVLIFLIIPSILPESFQTAKSIKKGFNEKIYATTLGINTPDSAIQQISNWASLNLPKDAKVLVIDREYPTPAGSLKFQYQGLYTLYSPVKVRVLRQEPGPEFFDLSLTLNPSMLKENGVTHLYIDSNSDAFQKLPDLRKNQLNNPRYFTPLVSLNDPPIPDAPPVFHKLYKINSEYLSETQDINNLTLVYLRTLIRKDQQIYLSDYPQMSYWYRMATALALVENKIALKREWPGYMAIETFFNTSEINPQKKYDYYLLPPDEKLPSGELIWSNVFASCWKSI